MDVEQVKRARYLDAVEGKVAMPYELMIDFARLEGVGEDLTLLSEKVNPDIVITPTYMTEKAVGCDCFAAESVTIEAGTIGMVPTGFKAKFDGATEGLFPFIRSSLPKKKQLILANGVGVVEEDYYGNEENDGNIGFMFLNLSKEPVTIKRFERVGQLVLLPIYRFENAGQAHKMRGASGSTGD